MNAAASSISSSATSIAATQLALAANVTTLGNQLVTFANDLTALSGYLTQLGVDVAALDQLVIDIQAISNSLLSGIVPTSIAATVEGVGEITGEV